MTWFAAKKDGTCSQCGAPVAEGERMWSVRRGYYVCEIDGLLRESASETNMGKMEAAVAETMKAFPPEVMGSILAQSMLYGARQLDRDEAGPRDIPNFLKELRQTLAQLEGMYPPIPEDDATDDAQKRRERRLSQQAGLSEKEWDD